MATMKRSVAWAAVAMLGLGIGAPARAADYPMEVGSWTVAASKDGGGCFMTRTYDRPGSTTLLLGLDRDGKNHLSVLNANWSIKPKDEMKLDFRLSKGGYLKHFAAGMAADGKQGFVTTFESRFPTYLASSRALNISRGDVPVERLDMDGSGAAVAELRKCVASLKGKPPAKATAQSNDDIPIDPFAGSPKRKSRK